MSTKLTQIMEAEKKVKEEVAKAKQEAEQIVNDAIAQAVLEANQIHLETDQKIKNLLSEKKQKLAQIDAKLAMAVQKENEKAVNVVTQKMAVVAERLYEEVIGYDKTSKKD